MTPGVPAVFDYLGEWDGWEPGSSENPIPRTRRQLALWLSRPDHPLTARVMVNRLWQWHFGQGIVRTSNNYGAQGEPPTHPELLDWLALEFVARGWDIKSMHRLIMSSSTYRMASRYSNRQNSELDPGNLNLWRMNRRRLEAEVMWDTLHSVAGTLNLKMGGRPAVPPLTDEELDVLPAPVPLAGFGRSGRAHPPGDLHPVPEKLHVSHVPDLRPAPIPPSVVRAAR